MDEGDKSARKKERELSAWKTDRIWARANKSSEKCLWRAFLTSNLTFQNEVECVRVCMWGSVYECATNTKKNDA